jgi:endonuclease-8
MPEGDSVAGDAQRLRPILVGRKIVSVGGTAPSVRSNSHRILDETVDDVRTIGKHLMVDLSSGWSIRVHLGMPGYWRITRGEERPHGSARLVLTTATHHAACFGAPTVDVGRTSVVDDAVASLGPDLLGEFDEREFLRRARRVPERAMAEVMVDQRVIAGIGNVYKSELLFLEGVHPRTTVSEVTDEALLAIASRARRLLAANVGPRARSTTGSRARGQETWVYGRAGRPCRRCATRIEQTRDGGRITYWCPVCQSP